MKNIFGNPPEEFFRKHAIITDLIKCKTKNQSDTKNADIYCQVYLKEQIENLKPKLIVCNGKAKTCTAITKLYPEQKFNLKFPRRGWIKPQELRLKTGYKTRVIFSKFMAGQAQLTVEDGNNLGKKIKECLHVS